MEVFEFGNRSSECVLVQPVDQRELDRMENEVSEIRKRTGRDFMLAAFSVRDWNRELSPWKAPAVFGKDDFGDGAAEFFDKIMEYCVDSRKTYYIGGYSLAGLFSLWAVHQTDRFQGVAAVSPSLWFPGFDMFLTEHTIACKSAYLSLGDKEEKVRNPVMATVGDRIRAANDLLKSRGVHCTLEWNEGNHFREPEVRTAKGFAWLLEQ